MKLNYYIDIDNAGRKVDLGEISLRRIPSE